MWGKERRRKTPTHSNSIETWDKEGLARIGEPTALVSYKREKGNTIVLYAHSSQREEREQKSKGRQANTESRGDAGQQERDREGQAEHLSKTNEVDRHR